MIEPSHLSQYIKVLSLDMSSIYIHIVFVTLFLIFKFIFIYLLRLLFVLKIEGIFGKRKSQPKRA